VGVFSRHGVGAAGDVGAFSRHGAGAGGQGPPIGHGYAAGEGDGPRAGAESRPVPPAETRSAAAGQLVALVVAGLDLAAFALAGAVLVAGAVPVAVSV
jgi:hypothetical protein